MSIYLYIFIMTIGIIAEVFVATIACLESHDKLFDAIKKVKQAKASNTDELSWKPSEEDDMLMDELESYILYDKEFNDEQKSWRIKRLKSFRSRLHWKPGKEQMKCLDLAITEANSHKSYDLASGLEKLREKLKEL